MKHIRLAGFAAVILLMLLLLAGSCFAADSGAERLYGKSFAIVGDSISVGYGLSSPNEGWPLQIAKDHRLTLLDNHSISGSTMAAGQNSYAPMVNRVYDLQAEGADFIIIEGGTNDFRQSIPIGEQDSRDSATVLGALNLIIDSLQSSYPDAQLVVIAPWFLDWENDLGLTSAAYGEAIRSLCNLRGIRCFYATDPSVSGVDTNSADFREKYCISPTDYYHLNAQGQYDLSLRLGGWLDRELYGRMHSSFADLENASDSLIAAAEELRNLGIMGGTGENIFSPSIGATQLTLAVTLYRMAMEPAFTPIDIPGVPADSFGYNAVCWCVQQEIFSLDEFSPSAILNRGELVRALYACYRGFFGGSLLWVENIAGYEDYGSISDTDRTAWGWALAEDLLSAEDSLKPEGIVSRGTLALALVQLHRISGPA